MFVLCPPPKIDALQVFGKAANSAAGPACPAKVQGLAGLIGNTPLVRIATLSVATGCEVNASPASPATYTYVCIDPVPCWQSIQLSSSCSIDMVGSLTW